MKILALCFIFVLLYAPILRAEPHFNDIPPAPTLIPLRNTLGLRLGFITSGLFSSKQGRPFFYFDTGLRYKTDDDYLDIRLPGLIAGLDFLFYTIQKDVLNTNSPFNFFESMNAPLQYGSYLEPAMVRLGKTFPIQIGDKSMKLSGGAFFVAEFVFFALTLQDRDLEEFEPTDDPSATDPFVIAPGAFLSLGSEFSEGEFDLVLGLGPDLYQDDGFLPQPGWVIYLDLDTQYDVGEDVAISLRAKLSTYTHTEDLVYTLVVNGGVIIRLF